MVQHLQGTKEALNSLKYEFQWMPEYGCLWFFQDFHEYASNKVSISLIGLDQYKHVVHGTGSDYTHFSEPDSSSFILYDVGMIEAESIEEFYVNFKNVFKYAKTGSGNKKNAKFKHQGHLKTHGFIYAVLKQAHNPENKKQLHNTNVMNVGQHTGGYPCSTCWPLACAVFHYFLNQQTATSIDSHFTFQALMAYFDICLLKTCLVENERNYNKLPRTFDGVCSIMKSAAHKIAKLACDGFDVTSMHEELELCKRILKESYNKLRQETSIQFKLPRFDQSFMEKYKFCNPVVHFPKSTWRSSEHVIDNEKYENASKNLSFFPLFDASIENEYLLEALWQWLETVKPYKVKEAKEIQIKEIESMFWKFAKERLSQSPLSTCEINTLIKIVNHYRDVLHELRLREEYIKEMIVEMNSCETLVLWVAYCLTFDCALEIYRDIMNDYGVCLDYNDLGNLVLSNKHAIDTVKSVSLFLKERGTDDPLFLLNNDAPSFRFAETYSKRYLQPIWDEEKSYAFEREKSHWDEVSSRQKLASDIRLKIRNLENELSNAKIKKRDVKRDHEKSSNRDQSLSSQLGNLTKEIASLRSEIKTGNNELRNVLKAPKPVIQPLPKNQSDAMKVLFFLHMPELFQHLSCLSMSAAQSLIPKPWNIDVMTADGKKRKYNVFEKLHVEESEVSWLEHYDKYQSGSYDFSWNIRFLEECHVFLRMYRGADRVPNQIGPTCVDDFSSISDGVWYPMASFRISWIGGSKSFDQNNGKEFNPFIREKDCVVSYFTEKLPTPPDYDRLQWCLIQSGSSTNSRGNKPISDQSNKPLWLSKPNYLWFGKIRSYPHLQIRNIMMTLQERSLPFCNASTRTLLRQAMYHVGEISVLEEGVNLDWKDDMNNEKLLIIMKDTLEEIANEVSDSPFKYNTAYLIVEFSFFFSEMCKKFSEAFRMISRKIAYAARKWGGDCEKEIGEVSQTEMPSFVIRQKIFYHLVVFAMLKGYTKEEHVAVAIEYMCRAQNIFVEDENYLQEDLQNLKNSCQRAMIEESSIVLDIVKNNKSILTSSLRQVVSNIPETMPWNCDKRSFYEIGCFSSCANSNVGSVRYDINVINGIVLIDGVPPYKLPNQVTDHPMYERCFGDINFRVCQKYGFHETLRCVEKSLYQFSFVSNQLYIREVSEEGSEFDLLDYSRIQKWLSNLPEQLQQLYSHWWNKKEGLVFLQGIKYNERSVDYILILEDSCDSIIDYTIICKQVPKHKRQMDRQKLAEEHSSFDQLVIHDSPLIGIISKFESRKFIHIFKAENKQKEMNLIKIHLPRFGLGFTSKGTEFWCDEIANFKLSPNQLANEISIRFNTYLVLEDDNKRQTILVPDGKIVSNDDDSVTIERNSIPHTVRRWSKFEIHPRFGYITTSEISSRIKLATLLLATSSPFSIQDAQLNGEARAVELLRQCWKNVPFSKFEHDCLENLKEICCGLNPSVYILCRDLEQSSVVLIEEQGKTFFNKIDCNETSAYLYGIQSKYNGIRYELSCDEEKRVMGKVPLKKCCKIPLVQAYDARECPYSVDELNRIQTLLGAEQENDKDDCTNEEFPLSRVSTQNDLEAEMLDELKMSWKDYQSSRSMRIINLPPAFLKKLRNDVCDKIEKLYQCITESLHWTPNFDQNPRGLEVALLRLVDFYPSVSLSDLPSLACDKSKMKRFNIFLSPKGLDNVQTMITRWLQFCIIEDKINRLYEYSQNPKRKRTNLINELSNQRDWYDHQKPHWLAFEVEGQLQIKSEQFVIANHLLKNPGHIVQLNMGMGKTRVILPMLMLEWHFGPKDKVPRIHILSSLYDEVFEFMHSTCCASVLSMKLYQLPFSREITLDSNKIQNMKKMISQCQREGGIFFVEPEHRLSLELKSKMLQIERSSIADDLHDIIYHTPWYNIFDESDEILHQRFQLIYAHGNVMGLPQESHRYHAAELLLEVLRKNKIDLITKNDEKYNVKFPSLTIKAESNINSISKKQFRKQIASVMLTNLPDEYEWMSCNNLKINIKQCITQDKFGAVFDHLQSGSQKNDVLALRGLLAGDILLHCLMKRHRVDYGIARPGKKRIAIPFRSADTPSKRSEFAHPDCAIVLTLLAYYDDGLSLSEVTEVFQTLLPLGREKRKHFYEPWFNLSSKYMEPSVSSSLDKVEKIDLSNKYQIGLLHKYYGMNPKTINFWLNFCVFPNELQQYPQQLSATAWNLTNENCGPSIGFSGTNDNHKILPLQVTQYFSKNENPIWKDIQGTNGKMIDMILKKTKSCEKIGSGLSKKMFLDYIKEHINCIHAIIDCGALLAGIENIEVAKHIIDFLPESHLKGICFFQKSTKGGQWMILERSGRLLAKNESPLVERDTFVLFDEARCRGTDMKLKSDAVAVLTIGPEICKDKLIQGAGRMRQLEYDQNLIIVCMNSEFEKIQFHTKGFETINVLEWTLKNTFESTGKGMSKWASQGIYFSTTANSIEHNLVNEKQNLQDFYGKMFESKTVVDFVKDLIKQAVGQIGSSNVFFENMTTKILQRVKLINTTITTYSHEVDEECEREMELEKEKEKETEKEIQIDAMVPREEKDWVWDKIITASTPNDLPTKIYTLCDFVGSFLYPSTLKYLKFSGKVYLSENFAICIKDQHYPLNDYLRIVDAIVIFSNGDSLLVSERESNFILCEIKKHSKRNKEDQIILTHLTHLKNGKDLNEEDERDDSHRMIVSGKETSFSLNVDDYQNVSIQLFSGETLYGTKRHKQALRNLLKNSYDSCKKAKNSDQADPREFSYMRGLHHNVEHSDLEKSLRSIEELTPKFINELLVQSEGKLQKRKKDSYYFKQISTVKRKKL